MQARVIGDDRMAVSAVHFYRGQRLSEGTLYVARDVKGAEQAATAARSAGVRCAFAVPSDASGDPSLLLEHLMSAQSELYRWDADLKDAVIDSMPLQRLIDASEGIFSCPFAFVERDFTVLAASQLQRDVLFVDDPSDAIWLFDGAGMESTSLENGIPQMPMDMIQGLVEHGEFFEVGKVDGQFYYPLSEPCTSFGINHLGDDGDWALRLILALPTRGKKLSRGEELLAQHLFDMLIAACKHSSHGLMRSQSDSLHDLVRALLADSTKVRSDQVNAALRYYSWRESNAYTLVKFTFFEGAGWETASDYLCRQLERRWRNSVAIAVDSGIVWVFNHSLSPEDLSHRQLMGLVVEMMREYACKAGVSNVFHRFSQVVHHCLEAEVALQLGAARNPHFWYFLFADHSLECLLHEATQRFTPQQLAHQGMMRLRQYDAEHGAEFVKTLLCYLRHQQNTVRAAEELYVHRTTLIRRLQRIEEIAGIDLLDADACAYMLISEKLLEEAAGAL